MTEVTRAPPPLSVALAVLAAGVALLALAVGGTASLATAALGALALLVGLVRATRRHVTLGAALLVVAVAVAGFQGAGPEPLLVGVLATVVAWDTAEHGIGLGEQLGREAGTVRVQVVHAAATIGAGAIAAGVGYAVYRTAAGGQPVTAVVFLLVGAVALAAALRG